MNNKGLIMKQDQPDSQISLENPPWRIRPFILVMVDMRDWLFRYGSINLIWFVLSLTLILLPPATIALYYVAYHTYYNEEPSIGLYFSGMGKYFLKSYVWAWLMLIVLGLGARAILHFVNQDQFIGIAVSMAVSLLFLGLLFHYLPYLILENNPLKALKLSIFTALADPLNIVANAALIFVFGIPSILMIAPIMFILPITLALIGMYNLLNWLYNYERIDGQARTI